MGSMEIHGYPRISTDKNRNQQMSEEIHRYPWISVSDHGKLKLSSLPGRRAFNTSIKKFKLDAGELDPDRDLVPIPGGFMCGAWTATGVMP